jgi:DNA-3-methyladenine glycosylase II
MKKAIAHLRQSDPVLAGIIERVGPYKMQYREPEFCTLARSIVYQQLSGKAAGTIFGRLEQACARKGVTPAGILGLTDEELRSLGLSMGKLAYLKDLAVKTKGKHIRFDHLHELPDEEVIEHLTSVKGVGVWTAQMFLMFALRRPDVLPVADLGIRNAIERAYGLEESPKPQQMEEIAKPWRPYASIACWYLWRSLENVAAL